MPRPANSRFLRHTSTSARGRVCPSGSSGSPSGPPCSRASGRSSTRASGVLEAIVAALAEESRSTSSWRSAAIGTLAASGPSPIMCAWRPTCRSRSCSRAAMRSSPTAASTASRRRSVRASRWSWCRSARTSPTAPSAAPTRRRPGHRRTLAPGAIREAVEVLEDPGYRGPRPGHSGGDGEAPGAGAHGHAARGAHVGMLCLKRKRSFGSTCFFTSTRRS